MANKKLAILFLLIFMCNTSFSQGNDLMKKAYQNMDTLALAVFIEQQSIKSLPYKNDTTLAINELIQLICNRYFSTLNYIDKKNI